MSEHDKRHTRYRSLAMKVVTVAIQGGRGDDWAAYIDAVPGQSHSREAVEVARSGTKLPYKVAAILFPDFDELYEWRP